MKNIKDMIDIGKKVGYTIIKNGVDMEGKHYIFYTSSTGQMKDAEITLLEEQYWKDNQYALMCGLTEQRINDKGGINMGKFFSAG